MLQRLAKGKRKKRKRAWPRRPTPIIDWHFPIWFLQGRAQIDRHKTYRHKTFARRFFRRIFTTIQTKLSIWFRWSKLETVRRLFCMLEREKPHQSSERVTEKVARVASILESFHFFVLVTCWQIILFTYGKFQSSSLLYFTADMANDRCSALVSNRAWYISGLFISVLFGRQCAHQINKNALLQKTVFPKIKNLPPDQSNGTTRKTTSVFFENEFVLQWECTKWEGERKPPRWTCVHRPDFSQNSLRIFSEYS